MRLKKFFCFLFIFSLIFLAPNQELWAKIRIKRVSGPKIEVLTVVPVVPLTPLSPPWTPIFTIIAENLEVPWDLAFLPGGDLLVTERSGHLWRLSAGTNGQRVEIKIEDIHQGGEGGLLGLALHPNFATNQWLYLYLTVMGSDGQIKNQVVRYRLVENNLTDKTIIIRDIPGAIFHDGGRLEFGPDGLLYITTGDALVSELAQNLNSLAGKVLRLHDDGSIPKGNPFGTAVYSYGHRNPQGLAWDNAGRLWSTEHGQSALDEINLIRAGANYGWPLIQGATQQVGLETPILNSGTTTWAPASAAYLNGRLFFGGLRGKALYEAVLDGEQISEFKVHLGEQFGRLRTVRVGPDQMLYLTTSNREGRGVPTAGDDKIIRVNPANL